ncbi:carbohydrate sulfotransferase 9-like [Protopterus annectens]|uniref:carbohydrate sulfotransferase 9-like n=1 Tax=Protopterus annectens TaxID=7888 RepID=UPI001CFBD2BE|nr:carbohydrate sulfotransferase 9-like [Protopterus annectens]
MEYKRLLHRIIGIFVLGLFLLQLLYPERKLSVWYPWKHLGIPSLTFRNKLKLPFSAASGNLTTTSCGARTDNIVNTVNNTKNWLWIMDQRKHAIQHMCEKYNLSRPWHLRQGLSRQMYVEHRYRLIFCSVPKAGCSNWIRVIIQMTLNVTMEASKLLNVHNNPVLQKLSSYPRAKQKSLLQNYTKIMFSRAPIERLISAYRDKFFHSNPYYVKNIAGQIKNRYRRNKNVAGPVTFEEFARFAIEANCCDKHWMPIFKVCDPCSIPYDFIGRFEFVETDANNILRFLGAPDDLQYPSFKRHSKDPRTNSSIIDDFLKNLKNKEILDGIHKKYKMDFLLFNYSFFI